ncbi:glutamine amidotransferase [Neobittarella massiliensis]|uniref:Uncharacterized membrane protein n=1 Tax=uncultured Anaerotruncus sp. TaxID=905011 RepID=A0A1C6JIH6_9FIRM|nr:glutamine amidotransferase [Neobittarella massiliensis]SCJ81913.1 Uncharacterized membrane protein [uncultured Anaerotruncus sp.]
MAKTKVLFVGESWFITTIETKGFDQFTIGGYETEIQRVIDALGDDFEVTHMPAHEALNSFPETLEELQQYDVIMVSDVGANTFLLNPKTFQRSLRTANRLDLIAEFVRQGGGFAMIGGYLTFMGIEGKGKYKGTVIEDILPVELLPGDDRQEHPEGIMLHCDADKSELLRGMPAQSSYLLGYNKLIPKPQAQVLIDYQGDPMLACWECGEGRVFTWASDCAPHWMPVEFCESDFNKTMWRNMTAWAAHK